MPIPSTGTPTLHVVHCIDTEGPLTEDVAATFDRLRTIFGLELPPSRATLERLQRQEIPLGGIEADVARVVNPRLLAYNESWTAIRAMLDDAMSAPFRDRMLDSRGRGWVYSWHVMDHAGYSDNPRRKDIGFGNVFRFYRDMLRETGLASRHDELQMHFHPLSFSRNPLQCATSYANSMDVLLEILSRRVIEESWFPTAFRPGFHSERPDSHLFLEQWLPYDFANQSYDGVDDGQPDLVAGRFGDWRFAPASWAGYHPSHDDYQQPGNCRRVIFRCLNVGTRFNELQARHVEQACREAIERGSAILAFADHDYRDLRPDVETVRGLLEAVLPDFPAVAMRFSGSGEAAREHLAAIGERSADPLELDVRWKGHRLQIETIRGQVFGPQPFLAIRTVGGQYLHDNLDVVRPGRSWSYTFDDHTLRLSQLDQVAIASAGRDGSTAIVRQTPPAVLRSAA